jgi:transposase
MKPSDARHLSIEVQEYLRQQAIHLRQQGKTFLDIAEFLGVHRNTVSHWWRLYEAEGELALNQKQRGRLQGEGRHLSAEQELELQELILENFPHELAIAQLAYGQVRVSNELKKQGILVSPGECDRSGYARAGDICKATQSPRS